MPKRKEKAAKPRRRKKSAVKEKPSVRFTFRQGRYLAYIHLYRKLRGEGPSEYEIAEYFRVSPSAVHSMIAKLEEKGLIVREPDVPRSMRVAVPKEQIPELENAE